jgi:ketosteroid isomerase-like protein
MTTQTTRPTPRSAVEAWWRAIQDRDMDAIEQMTLDDYISAGAPGGRTLGKIELLEGIKRFLAAAVIEYWSISDLEIREHGDVAVCSYLWNERGSHGDKGFDFGGAATDVLIFRDGRWRHQVHHVSTSD